MKNNHNLSVANQDLIGSEPLFNKAVKSVDFPIQPDTINLSQSDSVTFICDHEGLILFADKVFTHDKSVFDCLEHKLILDFIHPEDVSFVIEYMVQLIQEKTDSLIIEARFLYGENRYFLAKWHVGYLRGLFYLYPITVPYSNQPTIKESKIQKTTFPLTSAQQLWKLEVSKTLFELDKMILKHLKSCTSF